MCRLWHAFLPIGLSRPITWAARRQTGGPSFGTNHALEAGSVFYLLIKAAISGALVAAISELARRFPAWGGLVASLPVTSLLAMLWLYRDTGSSKDVAALATGTFWFVLPSLPLFIVLALLLRSGVDFWPAFALCIGGTLILYALFFWSAPRLGIRL